MLQITSDLKKNQHLYKLTHTHTHTFCTIKSPKRMVFNIFLVFEAENLKPFKMKIKFVKIIN